MSSKQLITSLLFILGSASVSAQEKGHWKAEMNKIGLSFSLDNQGKPFYAVEYDKQPVILPSSLGFVLAEDSIFYKNFQVLGTERKGVDEVWEPVWGETKFIRNRFAQLTIRLQEQSAPHHLLNLIFRVFADGVAFRYEIPKQPNLTYFTVSDELTQFRMTGDHMTFWIPGDFDSNEYPYTTSSLTDIDNREMVNKSTAIAVRFAPDPYAVQTPLMMKSKDGLYINIHEAALINYPAMQLHVDKSSLVLSSSLVPDAVGNKAYLHAPFASPWRTIIVSNQAADMLYSKMILNLNDPSVIKNAGFIHPTKFVGVWWEMQAGKSGWNYSDFPDSAGSNGLPIPNGRHGANTRNVKRYIDFASRHGIKGVLVEGWNTGWEDWFGKWKENVFDFVTPYPDFDIREITRYAKSKGVHMIMHNETSGSVTNYERQMDTAFRFMKKYGYTAVKTGYVGKIIPRGEHHDGQWMINHYQRVAQKAAQYQIMLDAHEPVRPTGLQRTYPNWLASEAARGNEFNAFSEGNLPEHETILPFTRGMGGPMDYTPGIFKIKGYSKNPERQIHTTLAKQLALYVTMYSPLQMAADYPENYEAHKDAFRFIEEVGVDWDDTKILEAEPGDYLTIARKEKGKSNWFIGAITDENKREVNISLDFLDAGKKYRAEIYMDGPGADWKDHPTDYVIKKMTVDQTTKLLIPLAAGGGAAISIMPSAAK